ncbi:MAG: acyl-CoA dehydrogenase family protein [Candidatus Omnitrophica bacterium]|nr:acyl-CoA dehydrogenase family protein [Candidatus Omnitrophota bacterium]
MEITDNAKISGKKREALEVAEEAREKEWARPSFVSELFQGRLPWDLIVPFPEQSEEDRKIGDEFIARLEKFLVKNIDPDEVDRTGEIPPPALKGLAELGCFALKIPKEYSGMGFSQVNYNRILQLVASYCASTSVWISAHQSIGVPQPLMIFGTEEQKKKYLPRFRKGEISAFALTEPDVGSDPARMKTTAVPVDGGKAYLLNGEKLWCTNGPVADILVVMAQTPPKVVKGRERKQITAFIVEKTMPGIETVHRCQFMGLHGIQNGLLRFRNVKVPRENLLGKEGEGLKLALMTLNTGRLTMPAGVTGCAKWCLGVVRQWANEREQWGGPIGKHEAIARKISAIAATTFAMEAMHLMTAAMADSKKTDIRLEAAMAKLFCTEASWRIIDATIQIRGGRGYETAQSLKARGEKPWPVERLMRDARINTIIEGTSQIMRLFIAREAMDPHLQKLLPLMDPKKTPAEKIKGGLEALGHYARWYPGQWVYWIHRKVEELIPEPLETHFEYAEATAHRLARNLFLAMAVYQQALEQKQEVMTRLVNIGTDLFAMAVTISRALRMRTKNPNDGTPVELADLFCREARRRIGRQFRALFVNDDRFTYRIAQETLQGKYLWLEKGIVPP